LRCTRLGRPTRRRLEMHASKEEIPLTYSGPGVELRQAQWGDFIVDFGSHDETSWPAKRYIDLPGGRCQCSHYGYVIKGRMVFDVGGEEEVIASGQAYYLPPGHVPLLIEAGTEDIEFSPPDDLRRTMAQLEKFSENPRSR
jgi:hypothetical protein